jgi:hypothetical protein
MKLRSQFFSDLRRQLYTDQDDLKYFDDVSTSLRSIQNRLNESTAAVSIMSEQLFLVTCDDPGPLITMKLVLPMLRERLDALADAHAAKQAEAAEAELLSTVHIYPSCWKLSNICQPLLSCSKHCYNCCCHLSV